MAPGETGLMKRHLLFLTAMSSFVLGVCTAPRASSQNQPPRFDHVVRDDIFKGFSGDREAMARGLGRAADVLRADPNHAEAMVWVGSGKAFEAGEMFQKGDMQNGMRVWNEGLAMMNRAVELEPSNIGVRIPRGATLAAATRNMPPAIAEPLIRLALGDYAAVHEMQKDSLDRLSEHARGELLMGLADLSERSGGEWREWARRVIERLPANSAYARRAAIWIEKGELSPAVRTCLGCHAGGQ